ncbi:MAG: anthranilate phosphoribosyltransferase [Deltaproteobacteria bacterium]
MIASSIAKIRQKQDLTFQEAHEVFCSIARGEVSEQDIEAFLVALADKRESADEIAGAAQAMREHLRPIRVDADVVFDTAGTGGDHKGTFNISTLASFVVAGAGVVVAKHGNRSVSGCCGSADLLESLGVNIDVDPCVIEQCLKDFGFGFLFAPKLHPAMAHVQPVRRRLKRRTIFNILGPLINPALPTHQMMGVYDEALLPIVGQALIRLGIKHAMSVWGEGGYDEVSTTGKTHVCEVKEGHMKQYVLEPEKFGLARSSAGDLLAADKEASKHMALNVLKGMEGPPRDVVVFNAGCCLYLAGKGRTIKEGMQIAQDSIDSGAAIKKLNKLIEATTSL